MLNHHKRTAIVLAVAVATASAASAGVYRAVRRIPVREVEVAHHFVVTAARPLALGARVEAADLKLIAWPSSSRLPEAFTRIEDVVGRGVVAAVAANEPILESKLAPTAAGAGLSPAILTGMRAISIKVNDVIGVAGFAVPGARVDVVATVRQSDDAIARVLVSNVQVLTAGTRYDQQQPRDAKPIPSTVVTLMVTPGQAEKIALASTEGQLTLMLRNPLDSAEVATSGARLARITDDPAPVAVPAIGSKPAPAAPRHAAAVVSAVARPAAGPALYTVEAIRAGKRSQETIK